MFFIELKRALKRKSFLIALTIGMILCIGDILQNNMFYIERSFLNCYSDTYYQDFMHSFVASPVGFFALINSTEITNLFVSLIPILCAVSFGDSYLEDLNSGFLKNILMRYPKTKYLNIKFLVNFTISGITIALPLLIQLIFLLITHPLIKPYKLYDAVFVGDFNINLYLNHPVLYILLWVFIAFIFSGIIGNIALSISIINRNKFIAVVAPFILTMVVHILFSLLGLKCYSVVGFLTFSESGLKVYHLVITFIVMFLLTYVPFYLGGKSNEII